MTYRAAWYNLDGTPATGLDLGEVKPGQTGTITRLLKNIGDQPLSAVQFTLKDNLVGVAVKVNDTLLVYDVTYNAGALAPSATVAVEYTRTVPTDANPGLFSAFIVIRALT